MITVDHIKRTDRENFIRINQTLLSGRYFEGMGTLQFRLNEAVTHADDLHAPSKFWNYEPYDLMIAYVDGQIAGYCVYIFGSKPGVELYVNPRYRRMGIASRLVEAVRKHTGFKVLHAKPGFPGSHEFFKCQHIFVEGTGAVYAVMKELHGNDGYNHLPSDEFIKLYRRATKCVKLRLHHRLRKQHAITAG